MFNRNEKKRLLFITRNYPPIIGGLEKYSYDFYHNIKKNIPTELLAHRKGKKRLIHFGFRVLLHIINNGNSYSHIHLADASLSIFYPFLKLFSNALLSLTVHALDITYDNYLYQKIIPVLLSYFDKIICVSNSTLEKCKTRGIPEKICNIIPNAIDFNRLKKGCLNIEDIERKFNLNLKGKKIVFSVGRLIKRKGNQWFVKEVMPNIASQYVYIIAGDGPEKENIRKEIEKQNLQDKVFLLGKISDEEKICMYKNSEYFIMPNIKVHGDAEGFGITLIEAASYGLPSIASDIEGIKDAVINNKTGYLITTYDSNAYIKAIESIRLNSVLVKKFSESYSSDKIIEKYNKHLNI